MQSEESNTLVKLAKAVIEHAPEGGDAFWGIKFSDIEAALSAAEPVDYQLVFSDGRTSRVLYSKDEADRFKKASDITVDIRALYAAPPAPSVAVKAKLIAELREMAGSITYAEEPSRVMLEAADALSAQVHNQSVENGESGDE